MAAVHKAPASELNTLTLDHILADLDALAPNHALFSLSETSAQASGSGASSNLLEAFESGTNPATRKQHVELSHKLLANHRTAQRLNNERVSAAEVGLVLPSERSRASASSSISTNRTRGGLGDDDHATQRSTRTDLLHAKVADLQTQVDAWHDALEQAAHLVDEPRHNVGHAAATNAEVVEQIGSKPEVPAGS